MTGANRPGPPPRGGQGSELGRTGPARPSPLTSRSDGVLTRPFILVIGWLLVVCSVSLTLSYFLSTDLRGDLVVNSDWWSISFASFIISFGMLVLAATTCLSAQALTWSTFLAHPLLVATALFAIANNSHLRGLDRWTLMSFGASGAVVMVLLTYELVRAHLWEREVRTVLAILGLIAGTTAGIFFFVDGWWLSLGDISTSLGQGVTNSGLDPSLADVGMDDLLSGFGSTSLLGGLGIGVGERWAEDGSGVDAIGSLIAALGALLIPVIAGIVTKRRLALALASGALLTLIVSYLSYVWEAMTGNLSTNSTVVLLLLSVSALVAMSVMLIRLLRADGTDFGSLVLDNP